MSNMKLLGGVLEQDNKVVRILNFGSTIMGLFYVHTFSKESIPRNSCLIELDSDSSVLCTTDFECLGYMLPLCINLISVVCEKKFSLTPILRISYPSVLQILGYSMYGHQVTNPGSRRRTFTKRPKEPRLEERKESLKSKQEVKQILQHWKKKSILQPQSCHGKVKQDRHQKNRLGDHEGGYTKRTFKVHRGDFI